MSIVFDTVLPTLRRYFEANADDLRPLCPILINRDMNGRVCLVLEARCKADQAMQPVVDSLRAHLSSELAPHAVERDQFILFEDDFSVVVNNASPFPLWGDTVLDLDIEVIDRLASGADWSKGPLAGGEAPRIVFFSIKGGVGRSTALAVAAYALAEKGKKVLVLDLDLESPGLSSALLPEDRRPDFGIADWLVEDLVGNEQYIADNMVSLSPLSRNGEIRVVPAHGRMTEEYISKLGRIWMPKRGENHTQEPWTSRLRRLIQALEVQFTPDVVLVDSRAGIDDMASACVTSLGATTVLLFAIDGAQTWQGYSMLFNYWKRYGLTQSIGNTLQVVAALAPARDTQQYIERLREKSWDVFSKCLYEEISPDDAGKDSFNYDVTDSAGPHHPLPIRWDIGFEALQDLYTPAIMLDNDKLRGSFGKFLDGIQLLLAE